MLRFILVTREEEVEQTLGNNSGFLTRFFAFFSLHITHYVHNMRKLQKCKQLIIALESQHQGGHHQLPGQGSPTERYPYYDNRYPSSSISFSSNKLMYFMFLERGITATLAKRVGMNLFQAPCLGESYGL